MNDVVQSLEAKPDGVQTLALNLCIPWVLDLLLKCPGSMTLAQMSAIFLAEMSVLTPALPGSGARSVWLTVPRRSLVGVGRSGSGHISSSTRKDC